ncbi:MAG: DNA-formamidopyrimidine glycosylase family protein [Gemmatimonadaceae bacterium]
MLHPAPRKGKHQLLHLEDGATLHVHFRMTGDWEVVGAGEPLPRPRSTCTRRTRRPSSTSAPTPRTRRSIAVPRARRSNRAGRALHWHDLTQTRICACLRSALDDAAKPTRPETGETGAGLASLSPSPRAGRP